MISLPFGLMVMFKREWESQVSSRINRALKEFMEAMFHSPEGIELELQPGMNEGRMWEIIAEIVGKKRFRKRKRKNAVAI